MSNPSEPTPTPPAPPASSAGPDDPGSIDAPVEHPTRRRLSGVFQFAGFIVCLGLLAWVIMIALRPENREQLQKLSDASAGQIFALFGLTAMSILLNGLMFWALILPVKRLRMLDVVAVNAIATCLSYIPFKMSLVARVAIHKARDGLAVATIGAWFIAFIGAMSATIFPIVAVSVWRHGIDTVWVISATIGVLACNAGVIYAGRLLEGEAGLARIRRVMSLANMHRLADHARFGQAHLGMTMIARVRAIGAVAVLRLADIGVLGARFLVAAAVLDLDLTFEHAALLGSTFFVIGALSPSGEIGSREAGTMGIAALVGIVPEGEAVASQTDSIVLLTLFVSGSELVVRVFGAGFAAMWLRADKLIGKSAQRK